MTPYYDQDGVTIWHGDCREIETWDIAGGVTITDPPYGFGAYPTDKAPDAVTLAKIIERASSCAIFGYPETLIAWCVATGKVPDEWITWWPSTHKARGVGDNLPRESECVAVWGETHGKRIQRRRKQDAWTLAVTRSRGLDPDWCRDGDVWTDAADGIGNNGAKDHPNAKPESLMRKLVALCSDVGQVVADPFMGSGSTLVAAKQLGRSAIGIEIEERYCEIAAKRLAQGVLNFGEQSA